MSDPDHARMMLRMARKDLDAAGRMIENRLFAEEVFGFHAQQAAEKALKAWLSWYGVVYPRTQIFPC